MIEVFAGGAVLTSVAKHFGLGGIAVDKKRKSNARCAIFQLDLMEAKDRELLEEWLGSPLLLWVHFAPVCGTASRAREIPRPDIPFAPQPLRSLEFPLGLPSLSGDERRRVEIANELFHYTCFLFALCIVRGVLATMENPRGSYLWVTEYVLALMPIYPLYATDFQACMYGSMRDKWTRIVASFPEIVQMDATCNRQHQHLCWGFTVNQSGEKVWASAEESQYPRKLCVALVQIVLRIAAQRGIILKPESLHDISNHPLLTAKQSQLATGVQPKGAKIPPLVPDFQQTAVFLATDPADIPCQLLGKLPHDITLRTEALQLVQVPKHAQFLRGCFSPESKGGVEEQVQNKRKLDGGCADGYNYKVVFGLPWECESFIQKACQAGHPMMVNHVVPVDLKIALDKHVEWSECKLAEYRMWWCRKWLKRAKELEQAEKEAAQLRPAHVKHTTANKRLLLTEEILASLGYEDVEALKLLSEGSTLAGEIPFSPVFQELYKPCLGTVAQLEREASKRNQAVMASCKSSGDVAVDKQLLEETREEVRRGWARGPIQSLPEGAVVSRRFPLVQGPKTRMIDDYTTSGINDTAACNNKVDLHMIDTFASVIREFFFACEGAGMKSEILAKTYDLKSAYRQVPVREDHLRFSYFCIYNCESGQPELYQLLTLPFGASHSVYSFLRLSRMLYTIATRGLYLLTTNFYDDFILGSFPNSVESAKHSMELIFLLTGWAYATEGKKCTAFGTMCKALGVEFDFSRSGERILSIRNTEQRVQDLTAMISAVLVAGRLGKQDTLILRGKLGFADSFLHGRLGSLVLKQLADHAYGKTSRLSSDLVLALSMMQHRLTVGKPREVTAKRLETWYVYTDAAYEPETCTGGIGGALFSVAGQCLGWFGFPLDSGMCHAFGASEKQTIIYELELCAAVLALDFWADKMKHGLQVCFGDNDGARFSLIRGSCVNACVAKLMKYHLQREADHNLCTWWRCSSFTS
eukprot:s101_g37.t1